MNFWKPFIKITPEASINAAILSLVGLAVPIFTLQVYDRVLQHEGWTTLQGLTFGVLIFVIFHGVFTVLKAKLYRKLSRDYDTGLAHDLFKCFSSLTPCILNSKPESYWIGINRDPDAGEDPDAGGEEGPTHSAGLKVADKNSWPLVDLRVDWSDADPVNELYTIWQAYESEMDAYTTRAINPSAAPSYGVPGDL